ncbi:MAG: hypothetical protein UT29_C0001G0016 [Candidatus Yanofskybacteria bacterium GW2011_GWA1_39_13]|uniref:Serine hydrolase family protein n=1 Tax=Yanofskybacteria sp. (strain GW2011_GWA1_39_13) TaxID=1619019 RepID=A0A0G0MQ13_YANXG|nr:MAG: hypothetical protein UT29_C0001G0016 [Candidatus Yanofskybacteria bacterium GW2011_GWA1_39_13]
MKRVFIIHGWEGFPEEGWFPWLKKDLESKGFEVVVPQMPDPIEPKIEQWVSFLSRLVGDVDEDTYFVCHSIGCQAVIRYLETLDNKKLGGVIFVAGWFALTGLETQEDQDMAKPWLETPIDFNKVKSVTNNFVAIFSDNDPYVPPNNQNVFRDKLGCKIIVENSKGHFSGPMDGMIELPIVLEELLKMAE